MSAQELMQEFTVEDTCRCRRTTTLAEAARRMEQHRVSLLPVVNELLQLRGVIHARDLAAALAEAPEHAGSRCVDELTIGPIAAADADAPIEQVLALMRRQRVAALPTVDTHGVVVGMVRLSEIAGAVQDPETATTPAEADAVLDTVAQTRQPTEQTPREC